MEQRPCSLRRVKLGTVRVIRTYPHGCDVFDDLRHRDVLDQASVVFDVGANVGDTVKGFLAGYPAAKVYAFEPAPDTFMALANNVRGMRSERVTLVNAALSSEAGQARMDSTVRGDLRAIGDVGDLLTMVTTVDDYCTDIGVRAVDYLKIDTEGHDLEVIRGAVNTLPNVRVIQTEVAMNPSNEVHVPLETMRAELEQHGFRIFGLYDQWTQPGQPFLRRANCVFAQH